MNEFLQAISDWVRTNSDWVWTVSIVSVLMFVGTLVVVPMLLVRIPADYFLHPPDQQKHGWTAGHPAKRIAIKIAKNLAGALLVVTGLALSVPLVPGQGLLTILIGIGLMDLPGKRRLEVALLRRRHVYRAVDWLRRKANRHPLQLPPKSS